MGLRNFFKYIRENIKSGSVSFTPNLRIVEIFQDEEKDYFVVVQAIGKSVTFKMRPEKILANDKLTNQFAPIDIRSLTYLGYLGINAPQYKLLAERFSSEGNALFAVIKKGEKKPMVKSASEVLSNKKILASLDNEDVARISFFAASEANISTSSITQEKKPNIKPEQ